MLYLLNKQSPPYLPYLRWGGRKEGLEVVITTQSGSLTPAGLFRKRTVFTPRAGEHW